MTRIKTIILFFIFLFIMIAGCEKIYIVPDTVVTGSVIDSILFEPVAGATVTLYRNVHCRFASIEWCDSWESVTSGTSNRDGRFTIKFNDSGKEYRISASKEGYYKTGYWYKVSKDIEDVDCYLFLQDTLHLRVHNASPYDENDVLKLDVHNNGNIKIITTHNDFIGSEVDTTLKIPLYAGFSHQLSWEVTKNEITEHYADTIFCEVSGNNYYRLDY